MVILFLDMGYLMYSSYYPFNLAEGEYEREIIEIQLVARIPGHDTYGSSWIATLRDSHGAESFICSLKTCSKTANRALILLCNYFEEVVELKEWEDYLPEKMPEATNALVPVCQSCDMVSRRDSLIEIKESSCLIHAELEEYPIDQNIYRYLLHCDERFRHYRQNWSGNKIAIHLNEMVVKGKLGGSWTSSMVLRTCRYEFHETRRMFETPEWWGKEPYHDSVDFTTGASVLILQGRTLSSFPIP